MDDMISTHERVELRHPVLLAAFRGWNDAGEAATFAAQHLGSVWSAKKVASIDPEEFFDFQAVRPNVHLVDGATRAIAWPPNDFWAARLNNAERDVLILVGTEPNLKWRTFGNLVVEVARAHRVDLVVTLGALLADVPHSRPVQITGTAVDPDLVRRLGLQRSRYEGPTGIVGVLHGSFAGAGIDSVSLWAAVPHYLAVSPNPKAALALINQALGLIEAAADVEELEAATAAYEDRVAEIVASDDDIQEYVRLLEERNDERTLGMDPGDLPSGESLAAEFERFLQGREPGGNSDPS